MNNLIHELIEFRRIETGNREVRIEALNVSSLMKNTAKTFVDMAKSRNITFLSKIPEQVSWNSDKGFLNTIIINLISNAFKYTPDGKSIKIEVDTNDENLLVLRVANEGVRLKKKTFNMFSTVMLSWIALKIRMKRTSPVMGWDLPFPTIWLNC